ncbi:MAG: VIT domain-containing protein, partial [Flavobacteriales bacterium]|nr:VIT domain-containing protein [Flavobacteriales bacterium]
MRTRCLFTILTVFISLQLIAQDDDQTECPYFNLINSDTTGVSFALASTEVEAVISGVIANVDVIQTYINDGDSAINASYVFPMSTRAAIYGMEMHIGDRQIIAEIRRNEEAQELFDEAEENGVTASLLEQERPNVFQMSLANIQPGDTLQVIMNYTELLVPEGGEYSFVFPTVVGPRFTTENEPWVSQSLQDEASVQETPVTLNLTINGGMPLEASSPSHPADFTSIGNTTQTSILTNPGSDIEVDFNLSGNEIETGMLRYENEEENFFVSIIQPPNPDIPYQAPDREYVFIMDVSGSMNGYPIQVSKQLISDLLSDLNASDKFNIVFFAGGSATFAPNSVYASLQNIELALDMIDQMNAGGGTQLLPALNQALNMTGTEDFSRTFVILTDGFVVVEAQAFQLIREHLKDANFFSFGIGDNPNHYIIEGIAYVGEGESFIASDEADAYEVADRFKSYIETPVLTNIEVNFEGVDVYDVEPLTV